MDFDHVLKKLEKIEQRLARLEGEDGSAAAAVEDTPAAVMTRKDFSVEVAKETFEQPSKPGIKSATNSGKALGIVATICFVLAAGFIIKLSIDSGWLTPVRQIAIASLFGFSLVGLGFTLMKSDREYASFLPAAGIITLYLTVFGAYTAYALISFEMGLVVITLISALCLWLYAKIKHDVYAVTASVGAYVAPIFLGLAAVSTFSLYYFIVCSLVFSVISMWLESRILTIVSAYLAIFVTAVIGAGLDLHRATALATAAHFILFSASTFFYSINKKSPLTEIECWAFLPVLLIFYTFEYAFIEKSWPAVAPWLSLGFAGVLMGLYFLAGKRIKGQQLNSLALILCFATLAFFHALYLMLLPVVAKPWLFVTLILALHMLPARVLKRQRSKLFAFPIGACVLIAVIEFLSIIYKILEFRRLSAVVVAGAAIVALWSLIIISKTKLMALRKEAVFAALGAAHMLVIVVCYHLTRDSGSLAVSGSWLLYTVCVMVFAFKLKDEEIARSAVFVLAFAGGKALLYDTVSAATIVRILCLMSTGAVLYGTGFLLRKINSWQSESSASAPPS